MSHHSGPTNQNTELRAQTAGSCLLLSAICNLLSNTITSQFCSFSFKLVVNVTVGSFRPRDCSTASRAIFISLSALFSFHVLMTDLSLGRKIISSSQISVNFWTINSTFSHLFGIPIIMPVTRSELLVTSLSFLVTRHSLLVTALMFHIKVLSSQSLISTSYLIHSFCT